MDAMEAPLVFTARYEDCDRGFAAPSDLPLLLAAEQAGHTPLSSCRNGTCRTCLCRLRSGKVAYRIAWPGLSLEEKADDYILPCVAYPLSDVVLTNSVF